MLSALVLCSVLSSALANNYFSHAPVPAFPWVGFGYGYDGYAPYNGYGYIPAHYANGYDGYGSGYGGYGNGYGDYSKVYGAHNSGHNAGNYAAGENAAGNEGFAHATGSHEEASAAGHQAARYASGAKAAEGAHGSKKFGYFTQGSGPGGFYSKAIYGSNGFGHEASKGGFKTGATADDFKKGYERVVDNEAYGKAGFDKGTQAAGGYADGHASSGYRQADGGYGHHNAIGGHAAGHGAEGYDQQSGPHAGILFKKA